MNGVKSHLTPTQQRILGYLAAREAVEDDVRCSKRDIAQATKCSLKTVDRAVAMLRDEGILLVQPCHLETGGQTGNEYHIVRR